MCKLSSKREALLHGSSLVKENQRNFHRNYLKQGVFERTESHVFSVGKNMFSLKSNFERKGANAHPLDIQRNWNWK